jgi:hypothetical protein
MSNQEYKEISPEDFAKLTDTTGLYCFATPHGTYFLKNNLRHNEKGAAVIYTHKSKDLPNKEYWLNGVYYGTNNDFSTQEEWIEFAKKELNGNIWGYKNA